MKETGPVCGNLKGKETLFVGYVTLFLSVFLSSAQFLGACILNYPAKTPNLPKKDEELPLRGTDWERERQRQGERSVLWLTTQKRNHSQLK